MLRKLAPLLLLLASCATATAPLSNTGSLVEAVTGETENACPEWLKLEGEIDNDAAQALAAGFKACEGQAVVLEINSPGGNIFAALEIQKAIERHDKPVVCLVDGMAASAAFVTLQSCDIRMMTDRSILMAHQAAIPRAGGQQDALANATAALRAIDRAIALHCAKRMGLTVEAFEAHVSGGREWWMALEEAEAAHAVDFEAASLTEALKVAAEAQKPAQAPQVP